MPWRVSSLARSVSCTLLVFAIGELVGVVLDLFLLIFFLVVVIFVVVEGVVLVFVGKLELERRITGDTHQGAAFQARELVADVDIHFVNIDFGVTLGTIRSHANAPGGENSGERCSNYNENLIKSATNGRAFFRRRMPALTTAKTVLVADDTAFVRDRFK